MATNNPPALAQALATIASAITANQRGALPQSTAISGSAAITNSTGPGTATVNCDPTRDPATGSSK